MMKDLQDYQTRKTVLCEWYDRVIENNKLLQADIKALQEAKSNLQDGRFIVAVCGEMNSGKSTLLNALLFSEEVLPSYVTTMTAKIALMDGDKAERIEATLYTPDEFRQVVEASKSNERSAQELAEARESARAEGLKESDLLTDPARVISEDGLDKLVRFAAICRRGGIYSAYVNSVQLWADRSWLHQVTVTDTPGTNDPNPVRDSITRDWIQTCRRRSVRHLRRTSWHDRVRREVYRRAPGTHRSATTHHRGEQVRRAIQPRSRPEPHPEDPIQRRHENEVTIRK